MKAGVPLFDYLERHDTIWVYYPLKSYEGGWVCDRLTLANGEVREARAFIKVCDRFLSALAEEVPPWEPK